MEPDLSFPSLRMLFVDKFAYNPGQEVFPAIYIRDPSSGVQYELEDTDEVNDRCLLSLNIERKYLSTSSVVASPIDLSLVSLALDQIKQHLDLQLSSLTQELRDLRKAVAENRRSSVVLPSASVIENVGASSPAPTDRQF